MRLALFAPHVAGRSCSDCRRYVFSATGEIERGYDGSPVPQFPGGEPCGSCPKIPRGRPKAWWAAEEMTEQNHAAYWHYQRCRAVGRFPNDRIVERNAAIIASIEREYDLEPVRSVAAALAALGAVGGRIR